MGCDSKNVNTFDLVIANVNLIDGTGNPMQKKVSIGIKDGKITAIDSILLGSNTINGEGKYLIPGLFDCHVHTEDFQNDFPKYVHYGVTSIFITGGSICTHENYKIMRELGNQDSVPAPYVFHTSQHFTMEGRHPSKTYVSEKWRDGISLFYLKDTVQIEKLVQEVAQYPITGIKVTIEEGPTPPFVERIPQEFVDKIVEEASKFDLEVFAHVSDNIELKMAVDAGVQNLVHFTGVDIIPEDSVQVALLKKFRQRKPSWVTTLMIDKAFLYPLFPQWFDEEYLLPEYRRKKENITTDYIVRAKMTRSLLKETYGIESNDFSDLMKPQVADVQLLYEKGFNMILGTDVGDEFNLLGYSLHEEMQILEEGGMNPLDIIKMGTLNAANMLHAQDSLGSIEVGKIANLVLLDENPLESIRNTLTITKVIKNGVVQDRLIE